MPLCALIKPKNCYFFLPKSTPKSANNAFSHFCQTLVQSPDLSLAVDFVFPLLSQQQQEQQEQEQEEPPPKSLGV